MSNVHCFPPITLCIFFLSFSSLYSAPLPAFCFYNLISKSPLSPGFEVCTNSTIFANQHYNIRLLSDNYLHWFYESGQNLAQNVCQLSFKKYYPRIQSTELQKRTYFCCCLFLLLFKFSQSSTRWRAVQALGW